MGRKDGRPPFNSSVRTPADAMLIVADAMGQGTSAMIQQQEAQGQRSIVRSETLPARINSQDKDVLRSWGIVFGVMVEGDDLFQYVELPEGWSKVPTDHPLWTKLTDERGRERATIFYKAVFYDRDAFLNLSRRFNARFDYKRFEGEGVAVVNVTDGNEVIHTTDPVPAEGKESWRLSGWEDAPMKAAIAWLAEHYPDWEKSEAYWD